MTDHRDISAIRSELKARRDIMLFDRNDEGDLGAAPITGLQLRRVTETEVRGADSYHPFNYKGWKYFGQAFAIERPIRGRITKPQSEWKAAFENVGGVYIEAVNFDDVLKALGSEPPDVKDYLARAPMRRF